MNISLEDRTLDSERVLKMLISYAVVATGIVLKKDKLMRQKRVTDMYDLQDTEVDGNIITIHHDEDHEDIFVTISNKEVFQSIEDETSTPINPPLLSLSSNEKNSLKLFLGRLYTEPVLQLFMYSSS